MHGTDIATAFLRDVPPFDELGEEGLRSVARRLEAAYYRRGEPIASRPGVDGLIILRQGAVNLLTDSGNLLEQRAAGECFGYPIWVGGEQPRYRAFASEDSLLWHLPQSAFETLKTENNAAQRWFSQTPRSRLREAVFSERGALTVSRVCRRAPVCVDRDTSIRDAAETMRQANVSSVLVMGSGQLCGILTDKDLRNRVVAPDHDIEAPVHLVMTANPDSLPSSASTDDALLLMMHRDHHHLPVMDNGAPVGLVTAGDLLRTEAEHPLRLLQDIRRQDSFEALTGLSGRINPLFCRLVQLGRHPDTVGHMVTRVTDAFTTRLIELSEHALGPAPQPWAWVAFGSQAREEQMSVTDQDNGIIVRETMTSEAERWFDELAQRVCDGLHELGYVHCPGNIMASNPRWRVSLKRWMNAFDDWVASPEPAAVMHCSIFFDQRCIYGDPALVGDLQSHAYSRASNNQIFLRFMAQNALTHRPPVGFFRQFIQDGGSKSEHGLDMKLRGIVPIVDLARQRALEAAQPEPNSFLRIERATQAGLMTPEDGASLSDALNLIARLRMEHQAGQITEGKEPGNRIPVATLSPLMRRQLKAAFMLVREAQNALALRNELG